MVDVDRFYELLILRARPHADDPHLLIDNLMPTLLRAFEDVWDDGYLHGQLERDDFELAGNPYGPDEYPDWPRRNRPTV